MDARDLYAQLTPVPGLRQRYVTHVVFEIEVRIVDPVRHMQAAGQFGQPPPERRSKMQSGIDLPQDALERDSALRRR